MLGESISVIALAFKRDIDGKSDEAVIFLFRVWSILLLKKFTGRIYFAYGVTRYDIGSRSVIEFMREVILECSFKIHFTAL